MTNKTPTQDKELIDMTAVCERLRNLASDSNEYNKLGKFLASHLGEKDCTLRGFNLGCALALADLQEGTNGFTGAPIKSSLVGLPPGAYRVLELLVPDIMEEVLAASA